MVRRLPENPAVYEHMPDASSDYLYFELYNERAGVYGWAALDVRFKPFCLLHLEISKWGRQIFKELKWDWNFAVSIIKSLECHTVVLTKAGNLSNQSSYIKLIEKFGFSKPSEFTQSSQEI